MSFFKIIGGIALGVGAVAAAPFTGGGSVVGAVSLLGSLAGAGTIAAAVGAGAAGAAAGHALTRLEEKEYESDMKHAREEGIKSAEILLEEKWKEKMINADVQLQEFRAELESLKSGTIEYRDFCKKIIAMFGVAISVANCDGYISEEEELEIQNLISGLSGAAYPTEVLDAIDVLQSNPPSFDKAIQEAEKAQVPQGIIDGIIIATVKADKVEAPEEQALLSKWDNMYYSVQ